jgi:hypothetical protein
MELINHIMNEVSVDTLCRFVLLLKLFFIYNLDRGSWLDLIHSFELPLLDFKTRVVRINFWPYFWNALFWSAHLIQTSFKKLDSVGHWTVSGGCRCISSYLDIKKLWWNILIDLEAVMAVLVIFSTVSIKNLIVRLVTSNNNAVNISWNLGFKHIVI